MDNSTENCTKKNKRYGKHRKDYNRSERNSKQNEQSQSVKFTYVCPRCKQPILELSSALAEKKTYEPVHFDCVLEYLKSVESVKPEEKIIYIGQGRFAVVHFDNPHDLRHFNIIRIIEWEERDKKYEWRTTLSDMYSQVH